MPNTKKSDENKRHNQIKILASDKELERHGGRKELSKKFRAVRDQLNELHDDEQPIK